MSALSVGLTTFNSCNKAGSIPHFSRHLQSHPNDYDALIWRGRAYSITGDTSNAVKDFAAAGLHSEGIRRKMAEYREAAQRGDRAKLIQVVKEIEDNYPESSEWLSQKGAAQFHAKSYSKALAFLEKSSAILERGMLTDDPNYCWNKYYIGCIYMMQNNLEAAEQALTTALNSCETHTVSHIQLGRAKLEQNVDVAARSHYDRAKVLNPTLVPWKTFDAFKAEYQPILEGISKQMASLNIKSKGAKSCPNSKEPGGRMGKGGDGGEGSGSGSDDDDDDDDGMFKHFS